MRSPPLRAVEQKQPAGSLGQRVQGEALERDGRIRPVLRERPVQRGQDSRPKHEISNLWRNYRGEPGKSLIGN